MHARMRLVLPVHRSTPNQCVACTLCAQSSLPPPAGATRLIPSPLHCLFPRTASPFLRRAFAVPSRGKQSPFSTAPLLAWPLFCSRPAPHRLPVPYFCREFVVATPGGTGHPIARPLPLHFTATSHSCIPAPPSVPSCPLALQGVCGGHSWGHRTPSCSPHPLHCTATSQPAPQSPLVPSATGSLWWPLPGAGKSLTRSASSDDQRAALTADNGQ